MKSDLHTHSLYSDGSYNVKDLLDLAKYLRLECISLTDHDTVAGVREAVEYGDEIGIKVVPGIELSTSSVMSVHVLGYNIDYESETVWRVTSELLLKRKQRKDLIVEKLRSLGVYLDDSALNDIDNVGRAHIAKALASQNFVTCPAEAFDKYIGQDKPAYVPSARMTPKEGVSLIRELGGKAVIAHPKQLFLSGKLELLIQGLIPYGLSGLELYYPNHSTEDVYQLGKLAEKYGLFKTGGSDFHGVNKGMLNYLGACTCDLPDALN